MVCALSGTAAAVDMALSLRPGCIMGYRPTPGLLALTWCCCLPPLSPGWSWPAAAALQTEELQLPRNNNPRCGHIAGNVWGRALNSGVFVLRNRPPVKKALHRWHQILTDPSQAIHTVGAGVCCGSGSGGGRCCRGWRLSE